MKNCPRFAEGLVALAHGETADEAAAHAAACVRCAHRLAELRTMADALSLPAFDAPPSLVESAKAIMPPRERVVARLVKSSLGLVGARTMESDKFQLMFEAEPVRARLLYEREPHGWEITGQIEGAHGTIEAAGAQLRLGPEGRFTFKARTLAESECRVLTGGREVVIPAASDGEPDGHEPPV